MFEPNFFRDISDEMDAEVYAINRELKMGAMSELRDRLRGKPGADKLSMSYAGPNEVYTMGDIVAILPAGTDKETIVAALANPFDTPKKKLA